MGITPQEAREKGENEAAFARRIHALFTVLKPASWYYNNVRFDDEVTAIFFIALYPLTPGAGSMIIHVGILIDAARSKAMRQPYVNLIRRKTTTLYPPFWMNLCETGSNTATRHDAMADVYATIAMAQLEKEHASRGCFDIFIAALCKHKLAALIDVPQMKPLVHTPACFGRGAILLGRAAGVAS